MIALGVYLTAVGLHAVASGDLLYRNYLRLPAPAPVAIMIGIALIVVGFVTRR